jgi:hypothetical protein
VFLKVAPPLLHMLFGLVLRMMVKCTVMSSPEKEKNQTGGFRTWPVIFRFTHASHLPCYLQDEQTCYLGSLTLRTCPVTRFELANVDIDLQFLFMMAPSLNRAHNDKPKVTIYSTYSCVLAADLFDKTLSYPFAEFLL